MEDFNIGCYIGFIVGVILLGLIWMISDFVHVNDIRKQAIEKGFAEYNQQNGKWQWKEKAEKEQK